MSMVDWIKEQEAEAQAAAKAARDRVRARARARAAAAAATSRPQEESDEDAQARRRRAEAIREARAAKARQLAVMRIVMGAWHKVATDARRAREDRQRARAAVRDELVWDLAEAEEREALEKQHAIRAVFRYWRDTCREASLRRQAAGLFRRLQLLRRTMTAWRLWARFAPARREEEADRARAWLLGRRMIRAWQQLTAQVRESRGRTERQRKMDALLERMTAPPPEPAPDVAAAEAEAETKRQEEEAMRAQLSLLKKKKQQLRREQEMAERARERRMQKELIERRRLERQEEERRAREKQEAEARALEEKRARMLRRIEREDQRNRSLQKQKERLADLHFAMACLRFRGWRPWRRFLEQRRHHMRRALVCDRRQCLARAWGAWQEGMRLALMRRMFIQMSRAPGARRAREAAAGAQFLRKRFRAWQTVVAIANTERELRRRTVQPIGERLQLRRFLGKWKVAAKASRAERERLERRQKKLQSVTQWLDAQQKPL